nr:GGDEF domain-containing protein [Spirochaetaceae bacterium]
VLLDRQRKGASAYLGKPVVEDELITTVNIHMKKYMEYKEVLIQATIDELTGINNRRNLMKLLKKELTIRHLQELSLVVFDLDHFKMINDTYGHHKGDVVLSELGAIIRRIIRQYDIAGRYGGEEFLLILPETNRAQAIIVASKIQKKIKEMEILDSQKSRIPVTSSFGICSMFEDREYLAGKMEVKELEDIYEITDSIHTDWDYIAEKKEQLSNLVVDAADQALYYAKSTHCNDCHYKSEKSGVFIKNICPQCGSKSLTPGRDKVVTFDIVYES